MSHLIMRKLASVAVGLSLFGCTADQNLSDIKIIGGKIADYQPFMINISNQNSESKNGYCGGSWIAEGVILTAAHCVEELEHLAKISVSITRQSDMSESNSLNVIAVIPHPQYNPKIMHNDIALLFVEPLDHAGLSKPVIPIPLNHNPGLPEELGKVTVIGWGNATSYGAIFGDDLRQAEIPVVDLETCRTAGEFYSTISDNEICAGNFEHGAIDSCQGDSGGPLIAFDNGTPVLAGIVSWGESCALKGKPGVYARVSSYHPWIYEQIGSFKSPVTSNEKNIRNAIAQHCYTGFTEKNNPYPDDTDFTLDSNFLINQPLQLSKVTLEDSTSSIGSCKFTRLGLGEVEVEVLKSNTTANAVVKVPSLKQIWTGPVTEGKGLSAGCVNDTQESFYVNYSPLGFSFFVGKNFYLIGDEIEISDLTEYSLSSCTKYATSIVFGEKNNVAEGEHKFILALESNELGLAKKYFILRDIGSNPTGKLVTTLTLEHDSESKGLLSFENKTGNDIHTWQLDCKNETTLTDEYGIEYLAKKSGDTQYVHTFITPASIHGIIKDQATVNFKADFKGVSAKEVLKLCNINGRDLTIAE